MNTISERLEFSTEEIAVEEDLQVLKLWLVTNSVVQFKEVPKMVNGMMSLAHNH